MFVEPGGEGESGKYFDSPADFHVTMSVIKIGRFSSSERDNALFIWSDCYAYVIGNRAKSRKTGLGD